MEERVSGPFIMGPVFLELGRPEGTVSGLPTPETSAQDATWRGGVWAWVGAQVRSPCTSILSASGEVSGMDRRSGVGPSSSGRPEAPGVWPWPLAFEWSGAAWRSSTAVQV